MFLKILVEKMLKEQIFFSKTTVKLQRCSCSVDCTLLVVSAVYPSVPSLSLKHFLLISLFLRLLMSVLPPLLFPYFPPLFHLPSIPSLCHSQQGNFQLQHLSFLTCLGFSSSMFFNVSKSFKHTDLPNCYTLIFFFFSQLPPQVTLFFFFVFYSLVFCNNTVVQHAVVCNTYPLDC